MNRKDAGFTLVEILVTITLIGIVVVAVTTLFTSIQSVQRRTLYMETATREAQRQMESLRNNNYNSLTAGQTIDFTDELPDVLQNPTGTVTVSEPDPGLKRVDISVVYHEGDNQQEVNLSSLVGILGITQ